MGLARSAEEVARIQDVLRRPRFTDFEMLQVESLTRPETVARLLPPPLEPAGEALMMAWWGGGGPTCDEDYDGGARYVSAGYGYGDADATSVLAMWMNNGHAIILGHDVIGEPKTPAHNNLQPTRGRPLWLRGTSWGPTLDIRARVPTDLGPVKGEGRNSNLESTPPCDGNGLEGDAALTLAEFDTDVLVNRGGTGTVTLQGTVHDPVEEIEMVETHPASYPEGDLNARTRVLTSVPAEHFLLDAYGRLDDWSALDITDEFPTRAQV